MNSFFFSLVVVVLTAASVLLGPNSVVGQTDFFDAARERIEQHRKTDLIVNVKNTNGKIIRDLDLTVTMTGHQFGWGTAVVANRINSSSPDNQIYKQKLLENFNQVVFENDLKWPAWEGAWGSGLGWSQADSALGWLDGKGLPARGHYAAWATLSGPDGYGPGNSSGSTEGLQQKVLDHITEKLSTVGNRVSEWDVINHPVGWGPATYEDEFGLPFYKEIVNHSRSVAPAGMEMWMNEDNISNGGSTSDNYERILNYLDGQNAAPDGIGFQGHFKSSWGRNKNKTAENIYAQLDRFSEIIPRLQFTEFDIDVATYDDDGNVEQYDETLHAQLMNDYLIAAFSHEDLEAITLWGFWEDSHWLPPAALYNSDWTERAALTAYQNLVFDEWWTETSGITDNDGNYSFRGFKGGYEVLVNYDGREYRQFFDSSSGTFEFLVNVPEPGCGWWLSLMSVSWLSRRSRSNRSA